MKYVITGFISLMVSAHLFAAGELNKKMPDFTLESNQGTDMRLSELRGQVILLNFWATWCRPCIEEIPLLNELHYQYNTAGFIVLGVNIEDTTDGGMLSEVNAFINNRKITFPILYDPQKVLVSRIEKHIMNRRMGLPTTVFIDKNGHARYLHEGYSPGDEREYRRLIELLIRE